MNYLANNLNNSLTLSYDLMRLVYEYADPLNAIRKQIKNKEYDLDEIMYKRMKKHIIKNEYDKSNISYCLHNHIGQRYGFMFITNSNIDNIELKYMILNAKSGYKDLFLWKSTRPNQICGLNPFYKSEYRYKMLEDLEYKMSLEYANNITKKYITYRSYSTKQLYKKWLKII